MKVLRDNILQFDGFEGVENGFLCALSEVTPEKLASEVFARFLFDPPRSVFTIKNIGSMLPSRRPNNVLDVTASGEFVP